MNKQTPEQHFSNFEQPLKETFMLAFMPRLWHFHFPETEVPPWESTLNIYFRLKKLGIASWSIKIKNTKAIALQIHVNCKTLHLIISEPIRKLNVQMVHRHHPLQGRTHLGAHCGHLGLLSCTTGDLLGQFSWRTFLDGLQVPVPVREKRCDMRIFSLTEGNQVHMPACKTLSSMLISDFMKPVCQTLIFSEQ